MKKKVQIMFEKNWGPELKALNDKLRGLCFISYAAASW